MNDKEKNDMQMKEKQEVATSPEKMKPGRIFVPDIDIYETEKDILLFADLPGVTAEGLDIHLEEDKLRISGEVAPLGSGDEEMILREYETGTYQRQFTITEPINGDSIEAVLKDGVLKLVIPKSAKVLPKKISVNVG